ncbi:MAG: PDZ domain-containing protein [Planctomycetota bacterium]|nr:PDZ domain-containing protein [Planctomycetota bacterium]MDA1104971.1 PDZ domain-containing protein [Planctomycetota bacterium]
MRRLVALALLAAAIGSCPAAGSGACASPVQGAPTLSDARGAALKTLGDLGRAGRWNDADRFAREWLQGHPDDELMLYNLACAQSQLGDQRRAADSLRQAMHAGFMEWDHMDADEDLAPLRSHESWESVVAVRDSIRSAPRRGNGGTDRAGIGPGPTGRAERVLEDWKSRHGETAYRYERDTVRKLIFISSLDPVADGEMKSQIRSLADHLIEAFFVEAQPDTVVVAIPTLEDAKLYLEVSDEPNGPTQGGVYDHGERALVSRDIGSSLRHEFTHAMHWGHMDRLRQRHPIWIMEGLAALHEAYELTDSGRIRFRPNERHNVVWDAINRGVAPSWDRLFRLGSEEFVDPSQSLLNYATARSIFEHLASQRKVEEFYRAYVNRYAEDPSGRRALETVWGKPIEKVEDAWKSWVRRRGQVDDTIQQGDASLGLAGTDAGDGVQVLTVAPGTPAERAGIREGDVIVQIGTRLVRSHLEMQLDLARRKVGEKVTVRFRRGDAYLTVEATLAPLGRARR